jgi:hypothetical protein
MVLHHLVILYERSTYLQSSMPYVTNPTNVSFRYVGRYCRVPIRNVCDGGSAEIDLHHQLSLPHSIALRIMNANTSNQTTSAGGTTEKKVIEAVGCRFVEYRGEGKPVRGNPPASPGDVYFDVKEQPYTVWVCRSDFEWNEWTSMAEGRNCQHPKVDRILYPSVQRLAWVPLSSYDAYLRQTMLRLGKRNDSADTHVKLILDHERGVKPAPPQIEAPPPNKEPSPYYDSDEEVKRLYSPVVTGSNSAGNVPNETKAETMEELRTDIDNRCRIMRVQNDDIEKALATSSGK